MANEDVELHESLINIPNIISQDNNHGDQVVIQRPLYSQVKFDEGFGKENRISSSVKTYAQKKLDKCQCSSKCGKSFINQLFPFIQIMRIYSFRHDLICDLISGMTVGIMHIPQGMAYGLLAQLPPIHGLYVSFFPVFVYFFFGSSKHVSVGTFAVVCLMVGVVVDKGFAAYGQSPNGTDSANIVLLPSNKTELEFEETDPVKLGFAMILTLMVGCIQLLMGICRLGFITMYLSDPLVSGFTTGAACHVFTSQVKHIFGVQMKRYNGPFKLIYSYIDFFKNIPNTNFITMGTSIICILFLVLVKELVNNNPKIKPKLKMPVPIELIVVVVGTAISYLIDLGGVHNVIVVGNIPTGIPAPTLPPFRYLSEVIADSIAIAIVAFAISVSMAKILAKKHEYEVNSNQELVAYGLCNIFSSFFSAFTCAASLSRSLVQENVGGRTQVTGLVSCCLMLIVLLVVGPLFKTLPNCILASIILVALKGMFKQFLDLKRLWFISKIDFAVWLVSFLATAVLDVTYGLGVGVGFSLLTVLVRTQRPYSCLLGQLPNTDIYRDITVYKSALEIPCIKIFRYEASLYFANVENFRNRVYGLTGINPRNLKIQRKKAEKRMMKEQSKQESNSMSDDSHQNGNVAKKGAVVEREFDLPKANVHHVIIDCSTMSYIDSVGVKALAQIINEYREVEIKVLLALCKAGVREMLEKAGFYDTVDEHCMFITIHDAVLEALRTSSSEVVPTFKQDTKNVILAAKSTLDNQK